ncbi:hypothetical protein MRX96_021424 [Rhipicephalus microplus]
MLGDRLRRNERSGLSRNNRRGSNARKSKKVSEASSRARLDHMEAASRTALGAQLCSRAATKSRMRVPPCPGEQWLGERADGSRGFFRNAAVHLFALAPESPATDGALPGGLYSHDAKLDKRLTSVA